MTYFLKRVINASVQSRMGAAKQLDHCKNAKLLTAFN